MARSVCGHNPSTIVAIERGERPNPHPGTLGELAKGLGVSPADLLED
jgi:transcriptional regulator with XRE-family HTH domain